MAELKPCPFCGGKASLFVNDGVRVLCCQCGISTKAMCDAMSFDGVETNATKLVIDAWNRRVNE